jgi:hypothetical protein
MAPTIALPLSSRTPSSSHQPVSQSAIEGWTMREMVHFEKHAKIMGISNNPAGCVERTRRASIMKVRNLISTSSYHHQKFIFYVIVFSDPADQY